MQHREIELEGGGRLVCDEAGAGGRPLLLVHGFTGARTDFADHLDALADAGWWALAPDLRGHGASWQPADEAAYGLELFAADVWALIDALGWDRLVLLGHSMGGMVAQVAALLRPDVLDGLVLMDTTHGPLDLDPGLAELGAELARSAGMVGLKEALDSLGDDGPLATPAGQRLREERPGYREMGDRNLLASSPAMYASMVVQMLGQVDRLDALAALEVPTLVIAGEQDAPFLDASRAMAEVMPSARLAVVPDAGHSPQFENPEAWQAELLAFLGSLSR